MAGGTSQGQARLTEEEIERARKRLEEQLASGEVILPVLHPLTDRSACAIDDLSYAISLHRDQDDAAAVVLAVAAIITEMHLKERH